MWKLLSQPHRPFTNQLPFIAFSHWSTQKLGKGPLPGYASGEQAFHFFLLPFFLELAAFHSALVILLPLKFGLKHLAHPNLAPLHLLQPRWKSGLDFFPPRETSASAAWGPLLKADAGLFMPPFCFTEAALLAFALALFASLVFKAS